MKLNKQQRKQLEEATCMDKTVTWVYPSGETLLAKVVDEVSVCGDRYKNVLQKIEPEGGCDDGSTCLYRFGYYVYSFKAKGVRWSQRPLVVTLNECHFLLEEARAKGWDI
jgi:hypothetical protein